MKNKIWLLFFIYFILTSCGSRKVASAKQETRLENQEIAYDKQKEEKVVFKVVRDTIYIESNSETKTEIKQEKQKQMTQKRREYYESGALKSEEEKNTTETEQVTQLQEELKKKKAKFESLKQENEKLLKKTDDYKSKITELEEKSKEKNIEREESFWLYILIGILGFIGGFAFDRLILK